MAKKLWGGRFREDINELVNQFNASIGFDKRLFRQDIRGSMAHCRMLASQGIIPEDDARAILQGLEEILNDLEQGKWPDIEEYEDIHGLVEKVLVDKIGPKAEMLHTARSRNDQVALDVRLFIRDGIGEICNLIRDMQKALVEQADANFGVILPGYTHLQRAQPVLLSHHLMAYYEMFKRDFDRFADSVKRVNVSPLGSAALAGTTFPINREMVAEELGFNGISSNSLDAVSDRDFVLEFQFNCAVIMMHLSRLSEELVLWSSQEFGFVAIADSYCTGSSIMPQKKNPDVPELVRGKTGRVYGNLMALLTTMKGLPLAYNKDMQEDKEGLFDTFDTVRICLQVMTGLFSSLEFNKEKMAGATSSGFLGATDLADFLVRKGLTFRKAHEVTGKMVLYAIDQGKELESLTLEEMQEFSPLIDEEVYGWLTPEGCIRRRNIAGGTGYDWVKQSIEQARKELGI